MTRAEFTISTDDMNRFNFKHLPEVIESYQRQLKYAKGKERVAIEETIAARQRLLQTYQHIFPEGPL